MKNSNILSRIILPLFGIAALVIIFKTWFLSSPIAGGDLDYFWNYDYFNLHPFAWNIKSGEGLGVFFVPFLWVYMAISIPINIAKFLNLPWDLAQRLIFFYPFLAFSIFSPIILFKKILPLNKLYYLAPIIFIGNTYILSVVQGGQLILALSYGFLPLTLLSLINLTEDNAFKIRKQIIAGLMLSLQILFDIRVGYLLFVLIAIYILISIFFDEHPARTFFKKYIYVLIIPGIIAILVNFFWILPIAFVHGNVLNDSLSSFGTNEAVKFLSFARIENSISLLHPNWPENIFGKVSFMKPEFLILPLLAYSSLLFIRKEIKAKKYLVFFVLIGIIGAFLAKGANDPLGVIYLWLFDHVPGFVMFRDSTKWYIFVVLSYSVLIPYSIDEIFKVLKTRFDK